MDAFFNSHHFSIHITKLMESLHIPGLSISTVFTDLEETSSPIIHTKAFGHANFASQALASPTTIYDVASTTKSFTATALAILISRSTLNLETSRPVSWTTPVSDIIPEDFVLPDEYATNHVTIEDILSHRTGMPRHDSSYFGIKSSHPDTPRSITRNLRNLPLSAPLRSKFQYSNMMYTVAAYLVEVLARQPFAQFLHENIFDKLNMTSTFLQPSAVLADAEANNRLSTPYVWRSTTNSGEGSYEPTDHFEQAEGEGAGCIHSTVLDYTRWLSAFLTKSSALFPAELYDDLTKPRIIVDPVSGLSEDDQALEPFTSHTLYALGWEVESYRGVKVVKHDGCDRGYGSIMVIVPSKGFGCAVFGNSAAAASGGYAVAMTIVDELLGIPAKERMQWISREIERVAKQGEIDKMAKQGLLDDLLKRSKRKERELRIPLEAYCGSYWNQGYQGMTVEVKDETLFIDATERSMGFTITLEHVADGEWWLAANMDDEGEIMWQPAHFDIEDGKAVRIGIGLEDEFDDGTLISFDRREEEL